MTHHHHPELHTELDEFSCEAVFGNLTTESNEETILATIPEAEVHKDKMLELEKV